MTLLLAEGVACRSCGAVRAPKAEGGFSDVCLTCWNKFTYASKGYSAGAAEDNFAQWLARKVFLDIKRMERTGVIGRCEAASGWQYGRLGAQCGHTAITMRGRHRVCGLHAKADRPTFVCEPSDNPYFILQKMLVEAGKKDVSMQRCIRDAAFDLGGTLSVDLA